MKRREFIAGLVANLTLPAAMQAATPVVGFLYVGREDRSAIFAEAFRRGLEEAGYINDKNLTIEYRWANRYDQLPLLAEDLVNRKVNVLFATPLSAGFAAKRATTTIPIVFLTGGDPVDAGLVDSLSSPGGNATGVSELTQKLVPKRLEFLRELLPQAKVFAMLVNPAARSTGPATAEAAAAAEAVGLKLHFAGANNKEEIARAFTALSERAAEGLLINPDPLFLDERDLILDLASRQRVPTVYFDRVFSASGGLMSYGPSLSELFRLAGVYVGRVLKGARPADLPVQQPTKFELVINLSTAKQLALTVPATLLARANEVVE